MNDYQYVYIIDEKKRWQSHVNKEGWKYASGRKRTSLMSKIKTSLFRRNTATQQNVSCCVS